MAITFTWSVKDMHRIADTGAVYGVDWTCTGVDADTSVTHTQSGSYRHMKSVTITKAVGVEAVENNAAIEYVAQPTVIKSRTKSAVSEDGSYTYSIVTTRPEPSPFNFTEVRDVMAEATDKVSATPDHTASGFVAYDSLDEATVLGWCKAGDVGTETEANVTSSINKKIAADATSTGMPWAAE